MFDRLITSAAASAHCPLCQADTLGARGGSRWQAVISIFTGPSVQSVAKAQLKKEMLSQGVRKSITEAVLPIVLGEVALPATATVASPSPSQQAEPDVDEGPRVIETIYVSPCRMSNLPASPLTAVVLLRLRPPGIWRTSSRG